MFRKLYKLLWFEYYWRWWNVLEYKNVRLVHEIKKCLRIHWRVNFSNIIHCSFSFLHKFRQKGPKNRVYRIFFWKCHLFFQKTMQNESSFDSWLLITNPLCGKILVLELLLKMFLANQIEDSLNRNICKTNWGIKLIFFLQINIRVSYKLVPVLLVGMARKLAISLYYSKKEVRDKYDFLQEDKNQSFLQTGSIIFAGFSQACLKYPR